MRESAEVWRPIAGYVGHYEVSDRGRVRSVDRLVTDRVGRTRKIRGKILSPSVRKSGHLNVNLKVGGESLTKAVHTLVLEAFVGPRPDGLECCHENGNPRDNRPANLRWDTRLGNVRDAQRHGTLHRTHCPQGHPYDEANTLIHGKAQARSCRECHRVRSAARHAARTDVQHGTHVSSRKTQCKSGHSLAPGNVYLTARGRVCKTCATIRNAATRARTRERRLQNS